ncbi:unnamed protein product [Haemonchus placei]|uniref:MFS domain-containing protein n=1 Tax=Haemonchus placei TaxID=6290 RepID=A0A0N4XAZ8_HAEPC|nr:unnamed protein product [Haemonchus placei]
MSDTDEEILSESPKRVDEILENKTKIPTSPVPGLSLLCGAFMFFCLFMEYHLAVAFNW